MGNIIALDVGKAKVGVATSDSEVRIPHSYAIWKRASAQAEKQLIEFIKEQKPLFLVVGLPLSNDGSKNSQCEDVENFVRRVTKRINVPVNFIDESYSSIEAQEILREQGKAFKADDAIAACLILERYFEQSSN